MAKIIVYVVNILSVFPFFFLEGGGAFFAGE